MNESPLDLGLLRTFYEVARGGSVTAAASTLHLSQPAVSHRLKALESDLGVRLFERTGRRLALSGHGVRLMRHGPALLAMSHDLRRTMTESEGVLDGLVTLGTLPTLASHLLVSPLAMLLSEEPKIRLRLQLGLVPDLLDDLRFGRLDLCLLAGHFDAHKLDTTTVGQLTLSVAFGVERAPSPLSVTPGELRKRRYLSWSGLDDPTMDELTRYVVEHRLADAETPVIPHIETLRELVIAGAGYTILPSYTLRRDERLGRLAVRRVTGLDARVPLRVARRKGQIFTRTLSKVTQIIRDRNPSLETGVVPQ